MSSTKEFTKKNEELPINKNEEHERISELLSKFRGGIRMDGNMVKERNREVEAILEQFNPKIKKCLQNTHFQEREDLEQEIKLKIIEKINCIKVNNPPSFWTLLDE